jgi:hypothetical protein
VSSSPWRDGWGSEREYGRGERGERSDRMRTRVRLKMKI